MWEEEYKELLYWEIEGINLGRNLLDVLYWKYGKYGEFSVKNFVKEIFVWNED